MDWFVHCQFPVCTGFDVKVKGEAVGKMTGNEFERDEDAEIYMSSPLSRTCYSHQSHSSRMIQESGWV